MTDFNPMQRVKRRFFAMRNGVVADTLRRGGSRFRIIFGLNLPQIVDIAREIGPDPELAAMLWANSTTRESRLLAPMLMSAADTPLDDALGLCADISDVEEADIFCHRFLRHHPRALDAAGRLADSTEPMSQYLALRLMFNLVAAHPAEAASMARRFADSPEKSVASTARRLADEASFYT